MDFTELFVDVDDFWKKFQPTYQQHLLSVRGRHRCRPTKLSISEIMTITIAFQTSHYRTFKHFYQHLRVYHRDDFPEIVCYERFVKLIDRITFPLLVYLKKHCLGSVTGISFVDSTALKVCSAKRIYRHRVFKNIAQRGKSSMGWFFGFKLHLIINEQGEILNFSLTSGRVDDRKPVLELAKPLWGKLFGDKGYISQTLFDSLQKKRVKLITHLRRNMKNKLITLEEKLLLRKRSLIETVNDQLKNVCQIEHSRHRKPSHFVTHLLAGLVAYSKQPKKPSIQFVS